MIARVFCILFFILAPTSVRAEVIISEIAWMGTTVGPNEEWIELHNDGTESVSVNGWTISDGVSLIIPLASTIGAGEYVLLERTDDDTVPGISALVTYTGALSNDGRTLTLKRADNSVEDSVIGGSAWENIGGDNVTKNTPQRTSSGWITGVPTPGNANSNEEATENEEETQTNSENESNDQTETTSFTTSSGGGSAKKKAPVEQKVSEPELSLHINAPKVAYVNQDVPFEMVPSGVGKTLENSLVYTWNFGDTYTGVSRKTEHTFAYPGEYIIVGNATFAKQNAFTRHEIKVLPLTFSLERTEAGDISIKNNAKYEVDIGGFTLRGAVPLVFPKFTLMKAGGVMTIAQKRIGNAVTVSLHDTQGVRVAGDSQTSKVMYGALQTSQIFSVVQSAKQVTTEAPTSSEQVKDEVQETVIRIGNDNNTETVFGVRGFLRKLALFLGF